jgi:hypothetical protein
MPSNDRSSDQVSFRVRPGIEYDPQVVPFGSELAFDLDSCVRRFGVAGRCRRKNNFLEPGLDRERIPAALEYGRFLYRYVVSAALDPDEVVPVAAPEDVDPALLLTVASVLLRVRILQLGLKKNHAAALV